MYVERTPPSLGLRTHESNPYHTVAIVCRISLILADALVVGWTWTTTYRTVRLSSEDDTEHSFARVLFVDGTFPKLHNMKYQS